MENIAAVSGAPEYMERAPRRPHRGSHTCEGQGLEGRGTEQVAFSAQAISMAELYCRP